MPMLAAQKPAAPITASPPLRGMGEEAEREAEPLGERRRHLGDAGGDRLAALAVHVAAIRAAEVGRDQREQQAEDAAAARQRRPG